MILVLKSVRGRGEKEEDAHICAKAATLDWQKKVQENDGQSAAPLATHFVNVVCDWLASPMSHCLVQCALFLVVFAARAGTAPFSNRCSCQSMCDV